MGRLGILFNIGGIFSAAVLKHFAALPSLRRFRGELGGGVVIDDLEGSCSSGVESGVVITKKD